MTLGERNQRRPSPRQGIEVKDDQSSWAGDNRSHTGSSGRGGGRGRMAALVASYECLLYMIEKKQEKSNKRQVSPYVRQRNSFGPGCCAGAPASVAPTQQP